MSRLKCQGTRQLFFKRDSRKEDRRKCSGAARPRRTCTFSLSFSAKASACSIVHYSMSHVSPRPVNKSLDSPLITVQYILVIAHDATYTNTARAFACLSERANLWNYRSFLKKNLLQLIVPFLRKV